MGAVYFFKCDDCGFEHEYRIQNQFDRMEQIEEMYKKKIQSGDFGPMLQTMLNMTEIDTNGHENYSIRSQNQLVYCINCNSLSVAPITKLAIWDIHGEKGDRYEINVDFFDEMCEVCKKCPYEVYSEGSTIKCPNCGSFGSFHEVREKFYISFSN